MASDGWRTRGSLVKMMNEAHDEVASVHRALREGIELCSSVDARLAADFKMVDDLLLILKSARALSVKLYFAGDEDGPPLVPPACDQEKPLP